MVGKANFVLLGADTPWVRGLCEALTRRGCHVIGVSFVGLKRYWSSSNCHETHVCDDHFVCVPPAYGTHLDWLTGNYLTEVISRNFRLLDEKSPGAAWLVATNPVAERWTHKIPDTRLIYWNYDDYRLYAPHRSSQMQRWEDSLVTRSHLVLCASRIQLSKFTARYQKKASKFFHFPNAVPSSWLELSNRPIVEPNTVGYVGNMANRVDWLFVYETASSLPGTRFIFAGSEGKVRGDGNPDWRRQKERALALNNVKSIGQVAHQEVAGIYQSFAINWMPYDVKHPFNVASCPTKIFDALATGRPFISTDLPECRAYSEYIRIVRSPLDARNAIIDALACWHPESERRQLDFARLNDWGARASFLTELICS